jgi:hypothetical protein
MLVKSQCNGNRVIGLYVGANNVRRFFPKKEKSINLQLDHLWIQCGLAPRFWDGEPEIHDPRLCLWLEAKQSKNRSCRAPMPLYMIPTGEATFALGFAAPRAGDMQLPSAPIPIESIELETEDVEAGAAA